MYLPRYIIIIDLFRKMVKCKMVQYDKTKTRIKYNI